MKRKLFILSIACMAAFAMPAQRVQKVQTKAATTKSVEATKVSTEEFNNLKATLSSSIEKMKNAANAEAVSNVMYNYTKSFLGMNKVYKGLSDYQKKQVDVLVKQFGTQSQAKIAKFGCKKQADAAIQKATMEALSTMGK
ncbi:MAG: hypothetical protein MJZ63_04695 [Muribaculaceae bacterium]|nr:hypothetical protein [Muribaculaceae bacterium]